jgi:hypothetical protein
VLLAYDIQFWLYTVLGLVALVIELWALADCVGRKADYFQAAFKKTKGFWVGVLAASTAVGALAALGAGGLGTWMIFQLAAVAAAGVYLADVKPALIEVKGGGSAYPW